MVRKIIIIGATSGIGKELACIYAHRGDKVAITGRRKELLEEIQQQYPGVITCCFDVTDSGTELKLHELVQQLGGVDVISRRL